MQQQEGISLRAYAAHRGVTLKAVQKARDSRRIPVLPNGRVDPAVADAAWDANTDGIQQQRGLSGGGEPKAPTQSALELPAAPTSSSSASEAAAPPAPGSLAAVQAKRYEYQALEAKLDYEERVGQLVRADEIQKAAHDAGRVTREAVHNVIDRNAAIVAAETDPVKVHKILTDEIDAVFRDLAERRPVSAAAS